MLAPVFAFSQKMHVVGAHESFYNIGRKYNVPPRELAAFNNITLESALRIGQVLKIPVKKTKAALVTKVKAEKKAAEKTGTGKATLKKEPTINEPALLVPVYHVVQRKEGLNQISRLYHISADNIKKWNKLKSASLNLGSTLIVGYTQSAGNENKINPEPPKTEKIILPESGNNKPAVNDKPAEPKEEKNPGKVNANARVEEKKEPVIIQNENGVLPAPVTNGTPVNFNGGIFKNLFESQANNNEEIKEAGTAGVFKSKSGWGDGKYYCLHNSAPAGTIVKITNSTTGKSIYAKVLDIMPDIKQNNGLLIRISNAAAEELGAGENNFKCAINYSK